MKHTMMLAHCYIPFILKMIICVEMVS